MFFLPLICLVLTVFAISVAKKILDANSLSESIKLTVALLMTIAILVGFVFIIVRLRSLSIEKDGIFLPNKKFDWNDIKSIKFIPISPPIAIIKIKSNSKYPIFFTIFPLTQASKIGDSVKKWNNQ